MQFLPGQVRLSDIVNGVLAAGSVPLDRLTAGTLTNGIITLDKLGTGVLDEGIVPIPRIRRFRGDATNVGAVVILANWTTICTLDVGTVVTGDLIFVTSVVKLDKPLAATSPGVQLQKSAGTATISWPCANVPYKSRPLGGAGAFQMTFNVGGIYYVAGGGTLTLKLEAISPIANSDVAADNAGFQTFILRQD